MALKPSAPVTNKAPATGPGVLTPPEERFWKRYSPHHELPLSSAVSVALHVLALVLLIVGGFLAAWLGLNPDRGPIPMEAVALGGGGGNPDGISSDPGVGAPLAEAIETKQERGPDKPMPVKLPELPPIEQVNPALFPEIANDPDAKRFLTEGSRALAELAKVQQEARRKLMEGLSASQGQGGTGQGGGKGGKVGPGEGPGSGPGKGNLTERQKRVLRWTMIFDTHDARDYLNQLDALGAILAVPGTGDQYRVVRDPKKEVKDKDIAKLKRIFWIDNKPESVAGLAVMMGLRAHPAHIVAFFPERLEKALLEQELRYQEKELGRKNENEIHETQFRVVRRGPGGYEPMVISQTYSKQ